MYKTQLDFVAETLVTVDQDRKVPDLHHNTKDLLF